jgi:DUF4097 and DUF4098 domain-containing protein YvlB
MGSRTMLRACVLLFFPFVWSWDADAQTTVNEKRPAAADGVVLIEVPRGTVDVKGSTANEVQVTGTVSPTGAQVKLSGDPRSVRVSVERETGIKAEAKLDVRVPAASTVRIQGAMTSIHVAGVTGRVAAECVGGDVVVSGAGEVELQNVNGNIELTGTARRAKVQTVNGAVSVKGGKGEISASSVNGAVSVSEGDFEHVRISTVGGSAEFEGKLSAQASLNAESVSGVIKLTLAKTAGADVTVTTMSGRIENGLGPDKPSRPSHGPGQRLSFSTGAGGAKVSIETLSGSVILLGR